MQKRVLGKHELPGAPVGERILVKPAPPEDVTDGGIFIPEIAQLRPFTGTVVHAGLKALDKMHDNGIEIGDTVWWGKFAGVIEEWDHLTVDGRSPCTGHKWARQAAPGDRMASWKCDRCAAERLAEPLVVIMIDDILVDENLQRRLDAGAATYKRGQLADGATQFYCSTPGDLTVPTVVPNGRGIGTHDSTRLPYEPLPGPRPIFNGGSQ